MTICPICSNEFTKKRKEQRFCSQICRQRNNGKGRAGQKTGLRQGAYKQRLTKDGYLRMYAAKHPYANGRKEIHVHVMVMEMHIGRPISPGECVHHINGIKTDNRLENLQLMSFSEHSKEHNKELTKSRKRSARGRYA
ncbi:hypothetical protein IPC339_29745 [Pseudomonas aeruginosa]|uniref:HNH endonuclease signature motif containing protein n=1 Tax=Pseudomonas aeruginosa TaxID=287 RepID=UPI000F52A1EE|nr:HNH endonuclease signature motif containing protein [Pseudomonas aeruginosa]MBM9931837.1 HNH endonuclease [Pseudomonas aeruginosa]RQD07174.1 hypothetical protein IPC339_29745 [Pseudomonas aeruginosa]RQG48305.1 hypothetical protein IPC203_31725 [Pseudomonas aeruginosa]